MDCPICFEVIRKSWICPCCNNNICHVCFDKICNSWIKKQCPFCRENFFRKENSTDLELIYLNLLLSSFLIFVTFAETR